MEPLINNTPSQVPEIAAVEIQAAESIALETKHITIDDFIKVEMKVGKILSAEKVEGSPKLLKLSVDFGEENPRQVLSGIAKSFEPEQLIDKKFTFVTNLAPRQIMGMESQAMILAAHDTEGLALFSPTKDIATGSVLG